jgi:hypothetical protein
MRRFQAEDGREWEVFPGRASWGAYVALFVPRDTADPAAIRESALAAAAVDEAQAELDALSDAELRARLADAGARTT